MELEQFRTSLKYFIEFDFNYALRAFFKDLNINLNKNLKRAIDPKDIIKNYDQNNINHKLFEEIHFMGFIDDNCFKGKIEPLSDDSNLNESIKTDYDSIFVLGVVLKTETILSKTVLSNLTRFLNRIFQEKFSLYEFPAIIVFKYGDYISFANCERVDYRKGGILGQKLGKISLLKDVNVKNPHRGHLSTLSKIKVPKSGVNIINTFNELYFYWQSIFSISNLNKDFYSKIIDWFNLAIKDIKIPSQPHSSESNKDFTVRLIARLIFMWFLLELKVIKEELLFVKFENGLDNKLIKAKSKGDYYYKFILQNLFFNALNKPQNERDNNAFDFYLSEFEDAEKLKKLIFFSPYLNGGLFDIHQNDWCEFGKANNSLFVPDYLFLDIKLGINSILSQYKFTISENTPLEEEIAVDPEMLGRIFENLLAEQSDDTKEVARKNAGAFYTPRSVVSYMCKNTLMKHLGVEINPNNAKEIVHKILETTILDPACGSGAFPIGMLDEIMQILETVDPKGNIWVSEMLKSKDKNFIEHISEFIADDQIRYVKKLGILKNCLFGVDILGYSIEITKLRCWLSLILEQKVDFSKYNYNLKPLPNLEFKFYKKNTLFRSYKKDNLNVYIKDIDKDNLLTELEELESEYFIPNLGNSLTKEEIKSKIINLLEIAIDKRIDFVNNKLKSANIQVVRNSENEKNLKKSKSERDKVAKELGELATLKNNIQDYFIEKVVFPNIFNSRKEDNGFDIVIGNPPYVNTKLISSMGISGKLEEEYGYCDDLYNHFTIRGLELLKKGGLLSYITSDTFLTIQSKKNMRMLFLGVPENTNKDSLFENFDKDLPESKILEIINTPKAFSALVDTAIFTLKKEKANHDSELVYIDLRKPSDKTFEISEEEWKQIKTSKENISGWERVLDKTFSKLGHNYSEWIISHNCDNYKIYKDNNSNLLKYKLSFDTYKNSINHAIFSPTIYNCQVFEKIVKPARSVFDKWWEKIETSAKIEKNRKEIQEYTNNLKSGNITLIGLLTDGGQGLATGNNGRFVGYKHNTKDAKRCKETRVDKLYQAIQKSPEIKTKYPLLANCNSKSETQSVLNNLEETKIWELFDSLKSEYDLRLFGKGYMYRIIPEDLEFDVNNITEEEKLNGISGNRYYVPYDKGDKEGNRWYLETPYLIDWSKRSVSILSTDTKARWQGYNFFFRNGFCWSESLNPNSSYIKCRLKQKTVNDVSSMSLYDLSGFGDEYIIFQINSYVLFKLVREFLNNTVKIQMNDIRKLPIKIPSDQELKNFKDKFKECFEIKKQYFDGKISKEEEKILLKPIELQVDEMVNNFYGITDLNDSKEELEDSFIDELILNLEDDIEN